MIRKTYKRRLLFSGLINFNIARYTFYIPCVSIYYDFDVSEIVVIINYKFSTKYVRIDFERFKTECLEVDGYVTFARKIFHKEYTKLFASKISFDEFHITKLGEDLLYRVKELNTDNIKEIYGYIQ